MFQRFSVKKMIFYIIMLSVPCLFIEGLVRVYFTTQVGPSVLWYGTMFSRVQKTFDPIGTRNRDLEKHHTVAFHENVRGNYSKYYPHQTRITWDESHVPIHVTINALGFRGKDFEQKKQPGVIRIVTLGASSTFGFYDRDNETYPYYMEAMLNEALPALNVRLHEQADGPIKAFEVINLGIPHLTSDQIYSLFMAEALDLEPDIVTFYEGINDASRGNPSETATEHTKQAVKKIPLANEIFRELRYRLLSVALVGMLISKQAYVTQFSEPDLREHIQGKPEYFIANLQRIHEECQRRGILFIVANQQAQSLLLDRAHMKGVTYAQEQAKAREKLAATGVISGEELSFLTHNILMDAERKWVEANHIPLVDVIGEMDLNRQYLVSWVHLNPQGNRIVASAFADKILKEIRDRKIPVISRQTQYAQTY